VTPVIFPELVRSTTRRFDVAGSGEAIETVMQYEYDRYGNITRVEDDGEISTLRDNRTIELRYAYQDQGSLMNRHIVGIPSEMVVRDQNGEIIRRRQGIFDGNGAMTEHRAYLEATGDAAVTTLGYDQYGNLIRITDPSGYTVYYTYDQEVDTHITEVTDSFNYISSATYDYRLGVPITETDLNGHTMRRAYDDHGRLTEVYAPYDNYPGGTPSVRMNYHTDTIPHREGGGWKSRRPGRRPPAIGSEPRSGRRGMGAAYRREAQNLFDWDVPGRGIETRRPVSPAAS
jgi:YD repeat-containing protein